MKSGKRENFILVISQCLLRSLWEKILNKQQYPLTPLLNYVVNYNLDMKGTSEGQSLFGLS